MIVNAPQIRSSRVVSCALWIMGEYCATTSEIVAALATLKEALGPVPFLAEPTGEAAGAAGLG